jgi:hypothetical protein
MGDELDGVRPERSIAGPRRSANRYSWRGAGDGPHMDMELRLVFTMRRGKIF